jgi:hypothetical protein
LAVFFQFDLWNFSFPGFPFVLGLFFLRLIYTFIKLPLHILYCLPCFIYFFLKSYLI